MNLGLHSTEHLSCDRRGFFYKLINVISEHNYVRTDVPNVLVRERFARHCDSELGAYFSRIVAPCAWLYVCTCMP